MKTWDEIINPDYVRTAAEEHYYQLTLEVGKTPGFRHCTLEQVYKYLTGQVRLG